MLRDTIMRLGARIGHCCAALHDAMMLDLNVPIIGMDELWSCVGKKQKKLTASDGLDKGATSTFSSDWRRSKRRSLATALASTMAQTRESSTRTCVAAFSALRRLALTLSSLMLERSRNRSATLFPGWVVGVQKRRVAGFPPDFLISTSSGERQNLTVRVQSRRSTRLTNGYSKRLDNHGAAVALYVAHYDLADFLRTLALPEEVAQWSLTTLREKLVKIGAEIVRHRRSIIFQMAEVAVPHDLFSRILTMSRLSGHGRWPHGGESAPQKSHERSAS